jgi:5-methylcytosine-specific restriction endonuclease McrA
VWDKHIGPLIGLTKCLCCKHQSIRQIEFHCAHIISEKNGGTTTINNLIPICVQCNLSMRTQNLNDFKNKYFSRNKKQIQSSYTKRNRKQTDRGPIIDSTLIDFRKNLY